LLLNISSAVIPNEGQSLKKRLRNRLPHILTSNGSPGVYNSFDIVGEIAVIKLIESSTENASIAANEIMIRHKNVKTVLAQSSSIGGEYRIRNLIHLAGENKTHTLHKESGCIFAVDLKTCYFSPRLSGERRRIAQLIKPNEVIVNMFAGVGCFSIIIAKKVDTARVFSIDINPIAVQYLEENVRINRVYGKVLPLEGDSKAIIQNNLQGVADRVIMPLPEKALEYLPSAISALKPTGGWIHYHCFEHAAKNEDPIKNAKLKLIPQLSRLNVAFEINLIRLIRKVGPNWHQIVADINIKGFDKF
jgi:tRNA (guanine37-N1)-methyltransferase